MLHNLVRLAAVATVASAVSTVAFAEQLRGYTYTSAAQPAYKGLERLGERVTEETNGRLTFTWNAGGSLPIPATSITQALGDGLIDLSGDGFYTSSVPVGGIAFLPMLFSTRDEFEKGYAALEPYLSAALEKVGVKLLAHYYYPLQTAFSRVPLVSLEDFNGKRVRTTSSEQAEFARRLGATPITIGTPEVPTSLQRGVVDVIFTASSGGARGYHEMISHNLRVGPNFHLSLISANLEKFNSLSAEDQKILMDAAKEASGFIIGQYKELEEKYKAEYTQGGMVVTEPNAETVGKARDLVGDYWDQWAAEKGGEAREALSKVRAAIGK